MKYLLAFAFLTMALVGAEAQSRDGKNRHVVIINASTVTVAIFNASSVVQRTWQEDLTSGP